jgi:hypothetical protein
MNALRSTRRVAVALAAIGLAASQTWAQTPDPVRAQAALSQAIAAEAQAARTGSATDWQRAADLYLQSASFRSYDDPVGVSNLRAAAMFRSHSDSDEAAELFSRAAERALAQGDVITAANSYIDAASALTEGRSYRVSPAQFQQIERWMIQATMLAESPLIDAADRALLLRRIAPVDIGNYAG